MTIREFEGMRPGIGDGAWVDDSAVVLGDVTIGTDSSVWPNCVLRGDIQRIRIGARSNIQDGTVVHVTHDSRFCPGGRPTLVGDDVTVGHKVMLHACTVEDMALIGMGAVILDGAVVGTRAMIGAGSVVPPNRVLEPGWLYVGNPVQKRRQLSDAEHEMLEYSAAHYVRLKDRHRASTIS